MVAKLVVGLVCLGIGTVCAVLDSHMTSGGFTLVGGLSALMGSICIVAGLCSH